MQVSHVAVGGLALDGAVRVTREGMLSGVADDPHPDPFRSAAMRAIRTNEPWKVSEVFWAQ